MCRRSWQPTARRRLSWSSTIVTLPAWERQVREKQKPAQKEQAKPPERESVLKRLRQLQAEGKQRNQPRQRKKSFDRDSR